MKLLLLSGWHLFYLCTSFSCIRKNLFLNIMKKKKQASQKDSIIINYTLWICWSDRLMTIEPKQLIGTCNYGGIPEFVVMKTPLLSFYEDNFHSCRGEEKHQWSSGRIAPCHRVRFPAGACIFVAFLPYGAFVRKILSPRAFVSHQLF